MYKYFTLDNNYIVGSMLTGKERIDDSVVEVTQEVFDSVPADLQVDGQHIYKYIDGEVVKDISSIDYAPAIAEFQSYAGYQLSSQFIAGFDGDLLQHKEELELVALGDMAVEDMAMSDAQYNAVIGQKMIIRRAVKQLKAYAGYLTSSILLLKNIDLSNALSADNPLKSLVSIPVIYAPVDYDISLSGTTLTLDNVGYTDYTDIVKGDFFFKCDSVIVRVNVFSDVALTDLSGYTSAELICWVGVDSVRYAVEG
jgi:hypothetical protein